MQWAVSRDIRSKHAPRGLRARLVVWRPECADAAPQVLHQLAQPMQPPARPCLCVVAAVAVVVAVEILGCNTILT